MRVLICDSSVLVRHALRTVFSEDPNISFIEVAAAAHIALGKLRQRQYDILIFDKGLESDDVRLESFRKAGFSGKIFLCANVNAETKKSLHNELEDFLVQRPPGLDSLSDASAIQNFAKHIKQIVNAAGKTQTQVEAVNSQHQKVGLKETISWVTAKIERHQFQAVVIGSSTGGPDALAIVFRELRTKPLVPIFLVQHMPTGFTKSLANRLAQLNGLTIREALHGDIAEPGIVYVAPGDWHMRLSRQKAGVVIELDQSPLINSVRPAVDPLFGTATECYNIAVLGIILTGMGEDGRDGCKAVKAAGGAIITQSEETCVVYGMPRAVYEAKLCDKALSPEEIGILLQRVIGQ